MKIYAIFGLINFGKIRQFLSQKESYFLTFLSQNFTQENFTAKFLLTTCPQAKLFLNLSSPFQKIENLLGDSFPFCPIHDPFTLCLHSICLTFVCPTILTIITVTGDNLLSLVECFDFTYAHSAHSRL